MKGIFDRVQKFIREGEVFSPELALDVVNFQLENNPIYRKFAQRWGKNRVKSLEDIPFFPVEFFKRERVFSCGEAEGYFLSSGTTGERSRVFYNSRSLQLYKISALRSFPFKGRPILSLIPSFSLFPQSSLSFMISLFPAVEYLNSSYHLEPKEAYQKLKGKKGVLFLTSTQLLRLSRWLEAEGSLLPEIEVVIETGGYKGLDLKYNRDELHDYAKRFFPSAEFWSEYGMAELFSQFYAPSRRPYIPHPWAEVLTRGRELLRVFDFASLCTVSALLVPDLVEATEAGFLVLGRATEEERGCGYVFR